jgi:hypothetical protein
VALLPRSFLLALLLWMTKEYTLRSAEISASGEVSGRATYVMRGLPILPIPSGRDSEALDLPPRYFMELRLPAFSGLGDEQENQAVPCFS